jgi:hypothetical protein
MSERTAVRIHVDPLDRSLLEGVDNGDDGGRVRLDLGLLPFFVDERPLLGLAAFIDWRTSGRLSTLVRDGVCRGLAGERLLLPGKTTLPVDRLVLVGLGASREFDRERARDMAREMVEIARGLRATRVLMAMPGGLQERSLSETAFVALAEAVREGRRGAEEARSELGEESAACAVEGEASGEVAGSEVAPPAKQEAPEGPENSWWVIAEPRHVSRMRRLLEGPPRPADPG